jgi:C-methyltransferase.
MRQAESVMELNKAETYIKFAKQLELNRQEMVDFLKEQKRKGKKVIGYGASTRGNTIMSYFGIGPDLVPYIADRNPIKFGRITSTGIPIISEDDARNMNPDFFLAFPYHFMKEFLNRESEFLNRGGKFISPIPKLTIIP